MAQDEEEIIHSSTLEENVWVHGKPVANLPSSDFSMSDERKAYIRKVLAYDIIDIRTYAGYKGDLIIQVTTMDPATVPALKSLALDMGFETAATKDALSVYKIYAISHPDTAYTLKEEA